MLRPLLPPAGGEPAVPLVLIAAETPVLASGPCHQEPSPGRQALLGGCLCQQLSSVFSPELTATIRWGTSPAPGQDRLP